MPYKVAASNSSRYMVLVHDKFAKHDLARKEFETSLVEEDENFLLTRRNPEMKAAVRCVVDLTLNPKP